MSKYEQIVRIAWLLAITGIALTGNAAAACVVLAGGMVVIEVREWLAEHSRPLRTD